MKLVCFNLYLHQSIYFCIYYVWIYLTIYLSNGTLTSDHARGKGAAGHWQKILKSQYSSQFTMRSHVSEYVNMSWYMSYNAAHLKMSDWALSFKKDSLKDS
jgi:hypothetical protein